MFQKRNLHGDYPNNDLDRSGLGKSKSNTKLNTSASKPPLSGRKQRRNDDDEEEKVSMYGEKYNINGRVHPGVSSQIRT